MTEKLAPIYPVTSASPPFRVKVLVYWRGRIFPAARTTHPKTKKLCWVTVDSAHEPVYLPPKGDDDGRRRFRWGINPDWWQPADPAAWKYATPAPLPQTVPQRPEPHKLPTHQAAETVYKRRWWRDEEYLIRYEPAGEASRAMVEARLMRALGVGRVYAKASVRRQIVSAFPELATLAEHEPGAGWATEEAGELQATISDALRSDGAEPLEPTPNDLSDWVTATHWFAALNPPELWRATRKPFSLNRDQKVLVWRALDNPLTWKQIGARIGGRHWTTAAEVYALAITRCHRIANGKSAFPHMTITNQMTELKERNRKYHLAA